MATSHTRLLVFQGNIWEIKQGRCCQTGLATIGLTDVTSRLSSCPSDWREPGQDFTGKAQGHIQPGRQEAQSEMFMAHGRHVM